MFNRTLILTAVDSYQSAFDMWELFELNVLKIACSLKLTGSVSSRYGQFGVGRSLNGRFGMLITYRSEDMIRIEAVRKNGIHFIRKNFSCTSCGLRDIYTKMFKAVYIP